jgi:hypothetical protein
MRTVGLSAFLFLTGPPGARSVVRILGKEPGFTKEMHMRASIQIALVFAGLVGCGGTGPTITPLDYATFDPVFNGNLSEISCGNIAAKVGSSSATCIAREFNQANVQCPKFSIMHMAAKAECQFVCLTEAGVALSTYYVQYDKVDESSGLFYFQVVTAAGIPARYICFGR